MRKGGCLSTMKDTLLQVLKRRLIATKRSDGPEVGATDGHLKEIMCRKSTTVTKRTGTAWSKRIGHVAGNGTWTNRTGGACHMDGLSTGRVPIRNARITMRVIDGPWAGVTSAACAGRTFPTSTPDLENLKKPIRAARVAAGTIMAPAESTATLMIIGIMLMNLVQMTHDAALVEVGEVLPRNPVVAVLA